MLLGWTLDSRRQTNHVIMKSMCFRFKPLRTVTFSTEEAAELPEKHLSFHMSVPVLVSKSFRPRRSVVTYPETLCGFVYEATYASSRPNISRFIHGATDTVLTDC
jgi:hypothetical protein